MQIFTFLFSENLICSVFTLYKQCWIYENSEAIATANFDIESAENAVNAMYCICCTDHTRRFLFTLKNKKNYKS